VTRLTWLPDTLRAAGLSVVELPGWRTRGVDLPREPEVVICHHTATPASAKGDLPTQRILIDGRSDLPGPLCQLALGRSGTVYIVAAGKANHAGKGAWAGVTRSDHTLGIEAENPGDGSPWPKVQLEAYAVLCATLLDHLGQPAGHCAGHKEWALPEGRKTDPDFDMHAFRVLVQNHMSGGHPAPTPSKEWDEMATKDEIRTVVQEELAKAVQQLHAEHALILHGDANHGNSIDSIAKKVGVGS
jgi:hypothetical protein